MVEKLGWQSLQQRRATSRVIMFYKIVYQLVAVEMPPYYSHPTRISARHHSLYFSQISTTKDYYKFSFFPRTIVLWNTLPDSIVTIKDLCSFKSAVTKVPLINSPVFQFSSALFYQTNFALTRTLLVALKVEGPAVSIYRYIDFFLRLFDCISLILFCFRNLVSEQCGRCGGRGVWGPSPEIF